MNLQAKLILAVFCLLLEISEGCEYKKFSEDHSFCKEPKESCDRQKSEVTEDDKKVILEKHNEYRRKIAKGKESRAGGMPKASNMLEMVWDDELASIAQKWADQCEFKHDCPDCRKVERFSVGQNLYTISSTGEVKSINFTKMMDAFYEEVKDFDKNNIKPFKSGSGYGHFTQVVWATSWLVGCGQVVYKEGGSNKSIGVCNYGPSGNINGGEMYKEGKPCSNCPSGTCCCNGCKKQNVTSNYPGLCKVLDEKTFKIDE